MKENLLFYKAYEAFYEMADKSDCFKDYCREAFGEDFSQDGFSDLAQIKQVLAYMHNSQRFSVLDIGCGNGKMLKYLQKQTGCRISGFDYSENAIKSARSGVIGNATFEVGVIGEMVYPPASFDLVTSMDTIYFAKDMTAFIGQVKSWLRPGGIFFVGYQEGDIMPKTPGCDTTQAALGLKKNGLRYEVADLTRQTYYMLRRKRQVALAMEAEFANEHNRQWLEVILGQTESAMVPYESYCENNARYIYIAKL